jgi:acyl-CoA synthetase (AMP-forming)/AMP-acid ligase II
MLFDLKPGPLAEPLSGRRWEPDGLAGEIARRIARLRRLGLRRGDRLLVAFGNRLEFFAELVAAWRLGACVVPIDARLTAYEVGTLAAAATPRLAVADAHTDAAVVRTLETSGIVVADTEDAGNAADQTADCHLDDDALILFTSGSTGDPKGVVHTHRSLRARWTALAENLGTGAFERTLCLLPTHFGHGLICNSLFPWLCGRELHVTPPFRPDVIMRLGSIIDEHRITFMSSVPSVWRLALRMAKRPQGGSLRRVHIGSAPLSADVWEDVRRWCGTRQVCNAYGITETGSWVAGLADADVPAEDGLVGPGWGAIVRVLSSGDTSSPPDPALECAPGEPGYVWLNTPALMKGYFQRDDLTRAAVSAGWFMTGDIGSIDRSGRLVLRGRQRDEINKGGMKIYPADIDVVAERCPGVSDVCTFACDDPVYGQTVGIAVVLDGPREARARELHGWMRERLAEHKMPVHWWAVEEIPRTSRGKINRDAVRAACESRPVLDMVATLSAREST